MEKGGPRFPRAKRVYGFEGHPPEEVTGPTRDIPPDDTERSDDDAVPEPIDDQPMRPVSDRRNAEDLPFVSFVPDQESFQDKIQEFQDALPPGNLTDPSDPDAIPNDAVLTAEDDRELEAELAAGEKSRAEWEKERFQDAPESWRSRTISKHIEELDGLVHAGFGQEDIGRLSKRFADEYYERLQVLSEGEGKAKDPLWSAEAYRTELMRRFTNPERKPLHPPRSFSETREIELPEDDFTEIDVEGQDVRTSE